MIPTLILSSQKYETLSCLDCADWWTMTIPVSQRDLQRAVEMHGRCISCESPRVVLAKSRGF